MAMKGSVRRVGLRRVQQLVSQLIQMHEAAIRSAEELETSGAVQTTNMELIFDTMGPSGTANSISEEIVGILAGTQEFDGTNSLDDAGWNYTAE